MKSSKFKPLQKISHWSVFADHNQWLEYRLEKELFETFESKVVQKKTEHFLHFKIIKYLNSSDSKLMQTC